MFHLVLSEHANQPHNFCDGHHFSILFIQGSGGSRPWDKEGMGAISQKSFPALLALVWSKNKGVGGGGGAWGLGSATAGALISNVP